MSFLPWSEILPIAGSGGGWILTFIFVYLVYSGRMIPRSFYKDQREVSLLWKEAYELERERSHEILAPMAELQTTLVNNNLENDGELQQTRTGDS